MPKENKDKKIWKYFKYGDVVRDSENSVWGNKLFVVYFFHGNDYCPLVSAYFQGKEKNNSNVCNLDVREIKLISAPKRPFKNINKKSLLKLMKKGNMEAKREFMIRLNNKK